MIQQQPAQLRIRVERAFYHQGKPTKVGDELTLPRMVALELIATNKASHAAAAAPAPAVQAQAEMKADKPKGGKDAG